MRNLILLLLLVLFSGILLSRSIEITMSGGNSISYELDEIANITFDTSGSIPDDMVLVQGGSFDMGDHFGEGEDNELPVHYVNLSAYYINQYEVTQLEYETLIGSNPSYEDGGIGDARPVNNVSYYDIMVYCNSLSMNEGLTPCYTIDGSTDPADWGNVPTSSDATWNAVVCDFSVTGYRLPTEAEWEYAAKGGASWEDHNRYAGCIEEADLTNYGWYNANNGSHGTPGYGCKDVGTKLANQLGLYDMSGNLWEWCYDWSSSDYNGSSSVNNPTGPVSGLYRIARGGGWYNSANNLRSAYRGFSLPYDGHLFLGFRLVRTAE